MTRPFYGNMTEVDYYRRSSRSMPLAISHAPRDETRSYPLGRRGSRGSPVPDGEADKTAGQTRRRIAVAVSIFGLAGRDVEKLMDSSLSSAEGVERGRSNVAGILETVQDVTIAKAQVPTWANANF